MTAHWLYMLALSPGFAAAQTGLEQRNPFDPQRLAPDKGLSSLPHQDLGLFELVDLKLVGTISQQSNRKALLLDPLQRIHLVAVGGLIGNGGWQITQIGAGHITLTPSVAVGAAPGKETHLTMEQP
ncbi:pilus assembly protein PilP [Paludibacterium purpuratum]|uniref:Pilus assembly protein PilP n=1 Tax=Paludibacterium purpuratum TaxID=1144873 RepID=A0A4R7B7S2_9NEIS|nr:pilus assembly protein PilP [Paludibacterium purpuratum]TDR80778.1 pilus assembly protein PilP [Paludibacterium purpuratum]